MKKNLIIPILLIISTSLFSQNKKILKIEKLFNSGNYEKCISKAKEYISDNKDDAAPYYFIAMSYYQEYFEYKDNFSIKSAAKNIYKGMQKENAGEYSERFKSEIDSLHFILIKYAHNYYEANKNKSKVYYDYLAKIYNDTLKQYDEIVLNKKKRPDAEIVELIIKGELNQTDENDLKQGKWKKVYSNGKTAYEVYFKDDKPVGEFKRYHENGKLSSLLNYDNEGINATAEFYDEKGIKISEGTYKGKTKNGLWLYYKNGAKIKEESYKDGLLNGDQLTYYEDGKIYDRKKFENDKQIGLWEKFHKNGKVYLKTFLVNGLMDGPLFRYYYSGKIEVKGQYKNDLKEGKWTFYSEDGQEDYIEYKNGIDVNDDNVEKVNSEEYRRNIEKGKTIADPEHYKNNPYDYPK
ncbi:MAG: hypothetical protein K8R54_00270 [Bacteroidales bacterium]|nr:hypothetical protein [Bacteroidales bacterium]